AGRQEHAGSPAIATGVLVLDRPRVTRNSLSPFRGRGLGEGVPPRVRARGTPRPSPLPATRFGAGEANRMDVAGRGRANAMSYPAHHLVRPFATTLSQGSCPLRMPTSRANWVMPATKSGEMAGW